MSNKACNFYTALCCIHAWQTRVTTFNHVLHFNVIYSRKKVCIKVLYLISDAGAIAYFAKDLLPWSASHFWSWVQAIEILHRLLIRSYQTFLRHL
jgi:hypothetical protein